MVHMFQGRILFSTWLERNSWCHISRFVCFKSNWRLALFVAFGRSSKIIKISWDCSTSSTNPTSAVVFTGLRTGLGLIHSYISYLNENRWNNQRFPFFVFYSFESQWRFTMQTSRIYVSAFGYKFDLLRWWWNEPTSCLSLKLLQTYRISRVLSGIIKLPILGGSKNANTWRFWEISCL